MTVPHMTTSVEHSAVQISSQDHHGMYARFYDGPEHALRLEYTVEVTDNMLDQALWRYGAAPGGEARGGQRGGSALCVSATDIPPRPPHTNTVAQRSEL